MSASTRSSSNARRSASGIGAAEGGHHQHQAAGLADQGQPGGVALVACGSGPACRPVRGRPASPSSAYRSCTAASTRGSGTAAMALWRGVRQGGIGLHARQPLEQRALARPLISDQTDLHSDPAPIGPSHVLPLRVGGCPGAGRRSGRGSRRSTSWPGSAGQSCRPVAAAMRSAGARRVRGASGRRGEPTPSAPRVSRSGDRSRSGNGVADRRPPSPATAAISAAPLAPCGGRSAIGPPRRPPAAAPRAGASRPNRASGRLAASGRPVSAGRATTAD